jgi:uncharacterized protein involved in exopolysaccharide biosynthesis
LQAQIAAKEVQIAALKSFATQENPDLFRAQEELMGLKAQLAKVGSGKSEDVGDVLLSMGKAPREGAEYIRKLRDVKYFETLYELLAKQYEIARIDEAKEATLIQVLDVAIAPEKKSKPRRGVVAGLTIAATLLLSTILVVTLEGIEVARRTAQGRLQIEEVGRRLRNWRAVG